MQTIMADTKKCKRCKEYKEAPAFYKDGIKRDKLSCYCRKCTMEAVRERRKKNPIKSRECDRRKHYKAKFGITLLQYDEMFELQNGVCAICGQVDITGRRLAVDHNHSTGEVRGLLCTKCNVRVGVLENESWRPLAERYLRAND